MSDRMGIYATVVDQLDNLSTRDRTLLTGMGMVLLVVIVGFITMSLRSTIDDQASRVRTAKDNLVMVQELAQDYATAQAAVTAAEARLKSYEERSLRAFVEQIAMQAGVNDSLRAVDKVSSEVVGNFQQSEYKVELKQVELEDALKFVYGLETSEYPLQVKAARFRTSLLKREKVIDLNLEVIATSISEAG